MTAEGGTQFRVGVFMAIGLAVIAGMVVYFGRFGEAVREYYSLKVEYPNASGIYKGASVLLAGAKVGTVDTPPIILPDLDGVSVGLKIYKDVAIPSKAEFTIGSSGLLGDRFVQIDLGKGAKDSPPIPEGATIKGKGESGMGDIFERAGAMVPEIEKAIKNINEISEKLNSNVFQETTIANLNETIANLRETSATFSTSAKKIDGVMQKVDGVVEKADGAMQTGKEALASTKVAAEQLDKALKDVRSLLQMAKQGRGALGALLSDKKMADDLRALVANLRKHGVLWYKDRPPQEPPR